MTLYQRPFVSVPLRESSCEPPHDSSRGDSHMPQLSPVLPFAPLLSSQAVKDELTTARRANNGFCLNPVLMRF